jgi:hypothetical protein
MPGYISVVAAIRQHTIEIATVWWVHHFDEALLRLLAKEIMGRSYNFLPHSMHNIIHDIVHVLAYSRAREWVVWV